MSSVSAIYVCAQILAINRGENLKILTVKVNIPDGVKNEFCWWCVNERSAWLHILTEIFFKIFYFFSIGSCILKCTSHVLLH